MTDFEIERIGGLPETTIALQTVPERANSWSRKVVRDALALGKREMEWMAPRGKKELWPASARGRLQLSSLRSYRNYAPLHQRIATSGPTYRPGGRGGGGVWTGSMGVRAEQTFFGEDWKDPALMVYRGTGRHGGSTMMSRKVGNIQAPGTGPMTFLWGGKQMFAQSTEGQRPQTQWVTRPRRTVRIAVRDRVRRFDIKNNAR